VSRHARARTLVWIRRIVQVASLLFFLGLLLATRGDEAGAASPLLQLYFDVDPLVLAATWLSSHQLTGLWLLALITLALTVLLGRVFCGWLCPLGVLHNALSWLRGLRGKKAALRGEFSRWQCAKYYLLFGLLLMALGGAHWIGVFDPASLLYRSVTTTVLPAAQFLVEDGTGAVYRADPHLGPLHLKAITEPVYRFFRDRVFGGQRFAFDGSSLVFLVFLAALLLNLLRPRFYCRYVCPLGGLLGLFSRRTSLRLVPTGDCGDCRLCTMSCPAAAQPEKPGEWLPAECFGCWNCVAACDERSAIDFRFETPWRRPAAGSVNLSRRATLGALGAGLAGLLLFRLPPASRAARYRADLIRPPGARAEREFLQRCVQCGLCMKVCPTGALHPTLHQAGLEGVWTPILVPCLGYCEFECNLCGQVCPTEAIRPLPLPEKKLVVIGLAAIDTTRCLPYAYGRSCIVCEEHCPIPDKAIYFEEAATRLRDGSVAVLKRPRVDAELCTGCGACEKACPFAELPAIRVTSGGETRHPDNQPLLPSVVPPGFEDLPADPPADPYGGN